MRLKKSFISLILKNGIAKNMRSRQQVLCLKIVSTYLPVTLIFFLKCTFCFRNYGKTVFSQLKGLLKKTSCGTTLPDALKHAKKHTRHAQ